MHNVSVSGMRCGGDSRAVPQHKHLGVPAVATRPAVPGVVR
jgi:hypothetical protein